MVSWEACETLGDRLKWVREEELGHSSYRETERFLRDLPEDEQPEYTSWGSVQRYEEEERNVPADYVTVLSLAAGVNPAWVLTGKGRPDYPLDRDDRIELIRLAVTGDAEAVRKLLDLKSLSEERGEELRRFLDLVPDPDQQRRPDEGTHGQQG